MAKRLLLEKHLADGNLADRRLASWVPILVNITARWWYVDGHNVARHNVADPYVAFYKE
jgi:hypothetical protein